MRRAVHCLLLFLTLTVVALADLELTFEVQLESQSTEPTGSSGAPRAFELRVLLGEDYLELEEAGKRVIYAFPTRRIHLVTTEGYQQKSLYSEPGSRVAELSNRLRMAATLDSAGVKTNPVNPVFSEHLLSLKNPRTTEQPERHDLADNVSFRHRQQLLFEASREGLPLKASEQRHFLRFLRYYTGGHPTILEWLAAEGSVPTRLTVVRPMVGRTDRLQFVLRSHRRLDNHQPEIPEGVPRPVDPDHPISRLAAGSWTVTPEAFQSRGSETLKEARRLLDAEDYLPSMLRYLEWALSTGRPLPPEVTENQAAFEQNAEVAVLLSVLGATNERQAQEGLEQLQSLKAEAGEVAYVLSIFEAELLANLREPVQAEARFLTALKSNPTMSAVWKDLGELQYSRYKADSAWLCWDTGRRLAPDHPVFTRILLFERQLEKDHPEYF